MNGGNVEDVKGAIVKGKYAPVVHGRWYQCKLNVPKGKGQTYLVWKCSNCHKHERKRSDYCPNCGARMDEEADDALD